jgi:hypothetical protein
MAGTITCYVCNTSATFDRQPLLFARYSSLHERRGWNVAPTFRADRAGGPSHDLLLRTSAPWSHRGHKWRRPPKDVVSAGKHVAH